MKKLLTLSTALLLCACGGLNKKTVSYQMGKYDSAQYYVVAGDGVDKKASAQNALDNMKRELVSHAPGAVDTNVFTDLMANASVEKTWRAPKNEGKHFYSLAVLSREKAKAVVTPLLNQADAQLAGLSHQFATPADPLADLKVVYKMQPIIARRAALDDVYQFVDASRQSYMPDTFAPYKNIYKEKLAAVLVGVEIEGNESAVLTTYIVDALNKMGLGVVDMSDPDKVLFVKIQTEVDGYYSKKVEGLYWVTSSAAVSLIDAQKDVTFSRFNVSERAGTSRQADSLRRSMQAVGEIAAQEIQPRLETYLKNK